MSRHLRLLVVEDDPAVSALLVAYLEKEDYQVDSALSAAEAEKYLRDRETQWFSSTWDCRMKMD